MTTEKKEEPQEEKEVKKSVKKKPSWIKRILLALIILGLLAGAVAYYFYNQVFGTNVQLPEDYVLTIPSGSNLEELGKILNEEKIIGNIQSFLWTARQMSYKPKSGKYELPKTLKSNYELIGRLRGSQLAIKLTFHNFRLKEQLAGHLGRKLEADSVAFVRLLQDESYLNKLGYKPQTIMALFIPNTYEVYWNTAPKALMERMQKEHDKFWNAERLAKADSLDLSPTEVYTLASIVETESQYKPERPRIAAVYLNRLKKGWNLEADPTVVFAVGDFSIRRVLNKHLEVESPYNTYKNAGLPPGPIYMASTNAIDAVLNAEEHDYMFFCAKPQEEGEPATHAFAKTHRAHINNAKRYWRWLRRQGY